MERRLSDPLILEDDGQTPLTVEEREGLIPSYITNRDELNDLHNRMFGRV